MIAPVGREPVGRWNLLGIYLALALLTAAVFGQTIGYPFVQYDDQNYVYENHRITAGLTATGLVEAFTHFHAENWHPLTTLSHMLDCQLWGLDSAGHHFVNVLLHMLAAALLFWVLNAMTGQLWRCALAAAVFAIHPLRVESVAWISERKDVLSGVFFMLTLASYVRYARQPSWSRYFVVMVVFALGLMSKPSLVTLPALLLLLDFWPLNRLRIRTSPNESSGNEILTAAGALIRSRCVIEKIPLILLSIGCALMTILAQQETVTYAQQLPFIGRLGNALTSYVAYIGQMLWPARLAVLYPDAADRVTWPIILSATLLLVAVTIIAARARETRPYLLVGWLWYLIALVPMIGLVQVGLQARADRYTYLSGIGLCIAVIWFLAELPILKQRIWRVTFAAAATIIVTLLGWCASIQTASWKDTESLWSHALAVTRNNDVAHANVAGLLLQRGQVDEAIRHYRAALRVESGREKSNHLSPAIIENGLGNAFARTGDLNAAEMHYRRALGISPTFADARSNLAAMLFRRGDLTGAISEYEKFVSLPPEDSTSHQKLAEMLMKAHRTRDAVIQYRRALGLTPDFLPAMNSLAWVLATSSDPELRNGAEALDLARRANQLTNGNDPFVLRTLAAALAASGRSPEAAATAEHALEFARDNQILARALERDLQMYRGT